MGNRRKPLFIVVPVLILAALGIMAVVFWPGSSSRLRDPGETSRITTTTVAEKKPVEPKIPPIDPKTDIITDEEGMQVVKGVLWIVWKKGTAFEKKQALLKRANVRGEIEEFNFTEIEVGEDNITEAEELLERFPEVEAVMRAYLAEPRFTPLDPDYQIATRQWPYVVGEAEQAWDISRGRGSRIAVIDEGFQLDHPDLVGTFLPDEALNYSNEELDKDANHGTHVSGIIGMQTNKIGLIGIAPETRVIPIKALTFAQMADAIRAASSMNNVRTINMSLGINWWSINDRRADEGKPPLTEAQMARHVRNIDRILMPAAEFAWQQDVAFIHAAGNDAVDVIYSELTTDTVIAVANIGKNDKLAADSNYGAMITLGAPGVDIWSTVGGSDYKFKSGTSMAAPMVAGTVALVRTVNPRLTVGEIIDLLKETAMPAKDNVPPRLNVWQALLKASDQYGVKGKVVDEDGSPVVGVLVRPKGQPDLAVKTREDGGFVLSAVPRSNPVGLEVVADKGEPLSYDLGPLADNQFVLRDINLLFGEEKETPSVSEEASKAQLVMYARLPARYEGNDSVKRKLEYNFSSDVFSTNGFTGQKEAPARVLSLVNDLNYSGEVSELAVGGKVYLYMSGFLHENHSKNKKPVPVTMRLEGIITEEPGYFTRTNKVEITRLSVDPYTVYEPPVFGGEGGEFTYYYEYNPEDFAGSSHWYLKLGIRLDL